MANERRQIEAGESEGRPCAVVRALSLSATLAIFILLAVGVVFGTGRLHARVGSRIAPEGVRVNIEWPRVGQSDAAGDEARSWLPADVRGELLVIAERQLASHPDPLSPESLRRVGEALRGTGWFERIVSVSRRGDGEVLVRGVWRVPLAVVRHGGVDYLVARAGELLPMSYVAGTSEWRVVRGARHPPPMRDGRPDLGAPWRGAEVKAGLDLLALAAPRPWWPQVLAADVSGHDRKSLAIVTRWNTRIQWGCAPGEFVPGEVSTERKLQRLDVLARDYRRIDAGQRLVEVFGPKTLVDATGVQP